MAQPLLKIAHRNGALPQVSRVAGASPQVFGDPLPSGIIETGTTLDNSWFANRVIQFQGDVYAVAVDGVYKKTDPTSAAGPWTQDHAFASVVGAGQNYHLHGPYQIVLNGVSSLFVIWATTTAGNTWNASILNGNTDVWTDVGEQVSVSNVGTNQLGSQIIYRGVLYVATNANIMTFDPGAGSFGSIVPAGPNLLSQQERAALGIFNDRLFAFGRNGGTGFMGLYEITGGSVVHLFDNAFNDGTGAAAVDGKYALFPSPDGSVMYGMNYTTTGGTGWLFSKFIDTAGTISFSSDLSSPVIPAGFRVGGGSGTASDRWWAFYDQETTPGTARLLIYRSPDGASSSIITQYVFVDEVSEITQEDSGGNAAWAQANVMTGGGERIFTPGELHIEIVDRVAVLGGEAVRFKAWGDVGAVDKNVEFRFNTQNEVPLTLTTLTGTPSVVSGPAAAPTLNVGLKRLESVEADGSSVYETVWAISSDGVTAGQRAQLVPRVFV